MGYQDCNESFILCPFPCGSKRMNSLMLGQSRPDKKEKTMFERISRLMGKLTVVCLNRMLDRGHHQWVHRFSDYWGSKGGINLCLPLYGASRSVQGRLIEEFKYPDCPSCTWSTTSLQGHFKESPYCRERAEWEDREEERMLYEAYEQDEWLRKDNEDPD